MATPIKLVLLPGLDGTGRLFSSLLSELPTNIEAVVISYPPGLILGFEQIVSYVEARIPRSPFVLLGESFSGPVAITIAAKNNINLKALILVATFARSPIPLVLLPLLPAVKWLITLFKVPPRWVIRHFLLSGAKSGTFERQVAAALQTVEPAVIASRLEILKRVNVEGDLSQVDCDLCHLLPSKDRLVGKYHSDFMKKCNPRLQVHKVEGPHLLLQISAKSCSEFVMRFIRDINSLSNQNH